MDFSKALNKLKKGKHVARQSWNGKSFLILNTTIWLRPSAFKLGDFPGGPFYADAEDMLAEDWIVVT